ncbi:DNA recombination protein RmuC [Pseudahrensia aquimaris]|uniref:DNA recombination protein RmuC homolog n=1 Tax=Pseudahrensia aquimaris TaxID=744461 RepID=A0ABW3FH65_9HYPH
MNAFDFSRDFLTIGTTVLSFGDFLIIALGLCLLLALFFLFSIWRSARMRALEAQYLRQQDELRAQEAEARMAQLVATQSELTGRLASMQDSVTVQQSAFSKQLDERLANVTGRVSQSLADTQKNTMENLAKLQERLAVIDTAQNNIQSLAQDVVGLQSILQNKQTRGAFGQSRMEAIVQDGLPMGSFEFQPTLSNGKRPDCTILMPNDGPVLVVDAKFPLEAWSRLQEAQNADERKIAGADFKRDLEVHVKDIAEKYFVPGETQDTAFLFVPSESIFAEIHEHFEGVVQKAHKSRIVIVSPSLLLLSVQVIQSVLKDARMREQAHLIQGEVMKFMTDLSRLDDRIRKLKSHHDLAAKDIDQILTSTDKLTRHGAKIESLEFGAPEETKPVEKGKPFLRAIESGEQ